MNLRVGLPASSGEKGLGFRAEGLGFRVQGLEFRVYGRARIIPRFSLGVLSPDSKKGCPPQKKIPRKPIFFKRKVIFHVNVGEPCTSNLQILHEQKTF